MYKSYIPIEDKHMKWILHDKALIHVYFQLSQVFEFALQEATHFTEVDEERDKAPPRKKKKKHRYLVLYIYRKFMLVTILDGKIPVSVIFL